MAEHMIKNATPRSRGRHARVHVAARCCVVRIVYDLMDRYKCGQAGREVGSPWSGRYGFGWIDGSVAEAMRVVLSRRDGNYDFPEHVLILRVD